MDRRQRRHVGDLSAFEGALRALLQEARALHADGTRLGALEFADERGWLGPEEAEELARGNGAWPARLAHFDEAVRAMHDQHEGAWRAFLTSSLTLDLPEGAKECIQTEIERAPHKYSFLWALASVAERRR